MDLKEEIKKHTSEVRGLPIWIQWGVAVATIFGTIFGGWGVYIVLTQNEPIVVPITSSGENVSSTPSLSDILSKALALETVIERQDFLNKYKDSVVRGEGTVEEVSRSGSGFLVDIKVVGQTITCSQESNENIEKQLLLLQNKKVQFYGKFPFTNIFGHGLAIDDCVLSRIQ